MHPILRNYPPYHLSIASLCSLGLFFSYHLCNIKEEDKGEIEKKRKGEGPSFFFLLNLFFPFNIHVNIETSSITGTKPTLTPLKKEKKQGEIKKKHKFP